MASPLTSYRIIVMLYAIIGLLLTLLFSRLSPAAEVVPNEEAPAAALSECVRAVLRAGPFPGGALVVLLVWAVAAPLAAARWFRWEEG